MKSTGSSELTILVNPSNTRYTMTFQTVTNKDAGVVYTYSGAFDTDTFSKDYTTQNEMEQAIEASFSLILKFIVEVEKAAGMETPEKVDPKRFQFTMPDDGGDKTGTLALSYVETDTPPGTLFVSFDGNTVTKNFDTFQEALDIVEQFEIFSPLLINVSRRYDSV